MGKEKEKFHFGNWLRDQIDSRGVPVRLFAERVGCSEATLHAWLAERAPRIHGFNRGRLARALGYGKEIIDCYLNGATNGDSRTQILYEVGLLQGAQMGREGREELTKKLQQLEQRHKESNVGAPIPSHAIPTFELPLAAGSWTEVTEMGEVCDPRQIDNGVFRVRLHGDSMLPDYRDGELVEFRCVREGRDALDVGKDYYVHRSDGCATFKQLVEVTEDEIVLAARNSKKYRSKMRVPKQEVVRMAKAIYRLEAR